MKDKGKITGTLERRKTSRWWYGSYLINGKRKAANLHIEVRGTPPGDTEEYGTIQYERSRAEAEAALTTMLVEINSNKSTEELAQAVHKARTGRRVDSYNLQDLPRLWEAIQRNKLVS